MDKKLGSLMEIANNGKEIGIFDAEEHKGNLRDDNSDSCNHYNAFNDQKSEFNEDMAYCNKEPGPDLAGSQIRNQRLARRKQVSRDSMDVETVHLARRKETRDESSKRKQSEEQNKAKNKITYERSADRRPRRHDYAKRLNKIAQSVTMPLNTRGEPSTTRLLSGSNEKLNHTGDSTTFKHRCQHTEANRHTTADNRIHESFGNNKRKIKYFDKLTKLTASSKQFRFCNTSRRSKSLSGYRDNSGLNKVAKTVLDNSHKWARVLKKPVNRNNKDK